MDSGEEIPGLNEEWTLLGAKLMEWVSGLVMCMVVSELFMLKTTRAAPILVLILLGTVFGLAGLRRRYPDEERGIRNQAMVAMGLPPPGIPAPSAIQPSWSAAPVRDSEAQSYYAQLDLAKLFPNSSDDEAD
jgi:hypothetical protein